MLISNICKQVNTVKKIWMHFCANCLLGRLVGLNLIRNNNSVWKKKTLKTDYFAEETETFDEVLFNNPSLWRTIVWRKLWSRLIVIFLNEFGFVLSKP